MAGESLKSRLLWTAEEDAMLLRGIFMDKGLIFKEISATMYQEHVLLLPLGADGSESPRKLR